MLIRFHNSFKNIFIYFGKYFSQEPLDIFQLNRIFLEGAGLSDVPSRFALYIVCMCTVQLAVAAYKSARYIKWTGVYNARISSQKAIKKIKFKQKTFFDTFSWPWSSAPSLSVSWPQHSALISGSDYLNFKNWLNICLYIFSFFSLLIYEHQRWRGGSIIMYRIDQHFLFITLSLYLCVFLC